MKSTTAGLAEIVGVFFVLAGFATVVAAAAMVSTVLAVLVSGAFITLAGVVLVYVAAMLERAQRPTQPAKASATY